MTLPHDTIATRDLMDKIYGAQRHFYDATRKYYLLGRDRLIRDLEPPSGGKVLEIGCGTGRNLVAAARTYPDTQFYGVDISTAMLKTARRTITGAGLEHRIVVAQADAADFSGSDLFGTATYDRVFFSFSLSMIPAWETSIANAMNHLVPGGHLHVIDFGDQRDLPKLFGSLLRTWLTRFHVTPRCALYRALRATAEARGGNLAYQPLYRGYSVLGRIVLQ